VRYPSMVNMSPLKLIQWEVLQGLVESRSHGMTRRSGCAQRIVGLDANHEDGYKKRPITMSVLSLPGIPSSAIPCSPSVVGVATKTRSSLQLWGLSDTGNPQLASQHL
jgi:hypothetical protein